MYAVVYVKICCAATLAGSIFQTFFSVLSRLSTVVETNFRSCCAPRPSRVDLCCFSASCTKCGTTTTTTTTTTTAVAEIDRKEQIQQNLIE